jgi:thioredoxin reductase
MWDVIIVGAGPAGLSAALLLGRSRRRVLICDEGQPRNAASKAMHGFLTRDGIAPSEFLKIAREELLKYDSLEFRNIAVLDAEKQSTCFEVSLPQGKKEQCKKLLLATGMVDDLPKIPDLDQFYGKSIFHCPYCDGWEYRDQPLAILNSAERGIDFVLTLRRWSQDLVLCTAGQGKLGAEDKAWLKKYKIELFEQPITKLIGENQRLKEIVFADGKSIQRKAIFFNSGKGQRSHLAAKLGCEFTEKGDVRTDEYEESGVPGLYIAGDAMRDVKLVIVAAAAGAKAAFSINSDLLNEEYA